VLKMSNSLLVLFSLFFSLLFLSGCNGSENLEKEVPLTPSIKNSLLTPTPLNINVPTQQPTHFVPTNTTTPELEDFLHINTPVPGISDKLCDTVPELSVLISDLGNNSKIYIKGKFTLCNLDKLMAFDLDKGIIGSKDDTEMDIYLKIGKTTDDKQIYYHLDGGKNAYVEHLGIEFPTYEDCKKILPTTNLPIRHGAIYVGVDPAGCVLTNEGRIGIIHIDRKDPVGFESVEISYELWKMEK
jgi:hypothetical protein